MRDDLWNANAERGADEAGGDAGGEDAALDAAGEPVPYAVRRAAADLRRGRESDERAVARVMAAVRRRPAPRRERPSAWRRLTTARTWRLSPLAAAALAASLVAAGALGAWRAFDRGPALAAADGRVAARPAPVTPVTPAVAAGAAPAHTVRFVLSAPRVSRVTLVGDFNGWNAEATPMHWDAASRSWTTVVTLPAGRYVYAFVLDGSRWMADPAAPLAPEDGFGAANSVVVVGGPGGGRI
jgi:Glycogen recognition site of AMP-activated protein kinase